MILQRPRSMDCHTIVSRGLAIQATILQEDWKIDAFRAGRMCTRRGHQQAGRRSDVSLSTRCRRAYQDHNGVADGAVEPSADLCGVQPGPKS